MPCSSTQPTSLQSRLISINNLLAADLLKDINVWRLGSNFCVKIYIFYSVDKDFLLYRPAQKGFPNLYIQWINSFIANVKFSLIINSELHGFFHSSSSLRKWCSLSPCSFFFVMDAPRLITLLMPAHTMAHFLIPSIPLILFMLMTFCVWQSWQTPSKNFLHQFSMFGAAS